MQKEVELVREKIRLACDRAGRDSETVLLLGVSKTKPYSALQEAYSYGIHDFGENKVQEIRQKYEMMLEDSLMKDCPPRFHMIGTLQKNKVKYLPGKVVLIHSVDSLPLSLEIEKEYAKKDAEENRPVFRALREALLSLQKKFPALPLTELSMGMSGDYEVAVEEGATIVRVGSFIFGERVYL